jgi:hypothetical protein
LQCLAIESDALHMRGSDMKPMEPMETLSLGELLGALVSTADACGDATAYLHESVTLHRLDGEVINGRAAVVDAISARGSEARLRVLGATLDVVTVALEFQGVEGHLRFEMYGRTLEGRLVEIWMRG